MPSIQTRPLSAVFGTVCGREKIPEDAIQLIEDTSRETTQAFMKMNQYVDVLIPRGGAA